MSSTADFGGGAAPVPAWRQRLATFWRWWTGELVQLVPERLGLFHGAKRLPLVAVEGATVVVTDPRPPNAAELARIPLASLEAAEGRNALRGAIEKAGETRSRARLGMGRDEALLRRVTLPLATEENLQQVIAFEMDRLTPFRSDEVYFDFRVASRDAAAGQIHVDVAVARRELVDARLGELRRWGVSVQGVAVRDDAVKAGSPLDLLPSEQRGDRESPTERLVGNALAAAVVALFVAALVLPLWQKRETVIALHPVLAKARQEAEATDAVARALEKLVADYNFLIARKHGNLPALAYIEEVSRLLPDNTWAQQLEIKPVGKTREVQIIGETSSSSRLIELLEQSTLLHNATPRGTVTRGSQPGTERFMIAAEPRPRPLPEPQPIVTAAAPPGAPPATPPAAPAPAKPAAGK